MPYPIVGERTPKRTFSELRRQVLPDEWPLAFSLLLYPVFWALGLGSLIWPVFAVPMAGRLILRDARIRVPRGFGLWILYLLWTLASAVSFSSLPIAFIWRFSNYLSVTVFLLYVFNTPREKLPTEKVVSWLSSLWLITVAGGWLGVLLPYGQFTSLMERIVPAGLGNNAFLYELIHPKFAQVQTFLGYPLGRPSAPYEYTNTWAAVYSLTMPFFFLAWLQSPNPVRRRNAYLLLAVSLVPVFVSLNRGLWLGLLVALAYGATRPGDFGRLTRRSLLALLLLGGALLVLTPLKNVVQERADNQHSNAGRTFLYEETIKAVVRSPIIGYGGPRPYGGYRIIPNLGTQGFLWTVLYSQGFVGLALFLGFLFRMIWSSRHGPATTFWCHVVLIITLVQLFVYDMIPVPLHVIFIAIALGTRESLDSDSPEAAASAAPTERSPLVDRPALGGS